MTINFHTECKKQLINRLAETLSSLTIEKGGWLSAGSFKFFQGLDDIPPKNIQEELLGIIGDEPIGTFFYSRIRSCLNDQREEITEDCTLSSISRFADTSAFAASLVDELETLPWSYTLFVQLPLEADCGIVAGYELSTEFSLVIPTEQLKHEFSFARQAETNKSAFLNALLGRGDRVREWNDKQFYLKGSIEGFIEDSFTTPTVAKFLSGVKSFLGLGIAVFLFETERRGFFNTPRTAPILVFRNNNGTLSIQDEHLFARGEMDTLQSIKLFSSIEQRSKEPTKFPGLLGLGTDFEVGRDVLIGRKLELISKAFKNNERGKEVLRAGCWYFDGSSAENSALKFVQLTTTLEILLGDQDPEENLTTLMANRAAYMIGRNHEERQEVIEKFKKLYKVRSKIVHRGHTELSSEERDTWFALLVLCSRVLERELTLLKVDQKREE